MLLAQNAPHPAFRQYTTDDGLASSEAYFILQGREGYIWISTDNGVSRFDGYAFRNYGLKDGLRENVIFWMQLDTLGRLWMQAMSGNLYYLEGQTIRPYWNNSVLLNFKDRLDTGKGFIVEGAGETVHIATIKYGLITITQDGSVRNDARKAPAFMEVFERNGIAVNANTGLAGPEANASLEKLLLQKRHTPVYFNTSEGSFSMSGLPLSRREGQNYGAFRLAKGLYLIKMFNDAFLIDQGKLRWSCYYPHHILSAHLTADGQLLVGLHFQEGLRVYPSIDAMQKDEGTAWLHGQAVSYIMESQDGGLWLATNENGIFYAPANAIRVYGRESGLPSEKVTAITLGEAGTLYAGFVNGEIWRLNTAESTWSELPGIRAHGTARALYFNRNYRQLWAGLDILCYLQDKQWIQSATHAPEGQLISMGNRITESPDGRRIWVCGHYGFMSIELPQKQAANFCMGYGQRTFAVRQDYSGRVWVGQPEGLFEWKDGRLLSCQNLHPAFSLRVEDIALLPDSTLVVATKGGGIVFWKGNRFEQITTEQGLTADMMENVYTSKKGVTWAGTLNGLNRISGDWGNREVEPITAFHGLPSNEIYGICSRGDTIWVATNKGLACFSEKNQNLFSPKPILVSVLANNQPAELSEPIRLPSAKNNLAISYLALNYKMKGQIPYRYRMDGGNWATTMNRSLNFPALPPGERLFEVQAQNEDGIWSESAILQFVIDPPWYATWWAKLLGIISIALIGPSIYLYRTGQLKKSHRIQLQMAELERSALQAQMNPHFIFNCLNSIQNYILQNEKEAAILYLGRFAALVRNMLNASVAGSIFLAEEVKLLNNYLELEKLRFKNRFTYRVEVAEGLDGYEIKIPPLLVQPYVENAVLHGMARRRKSGHVAVLFQQKDGYLEACVTDNGNGLPSGEEASDKAHQPYGMSITRRRLELLASSREAQAVQTRTLLDAKGSVCGTEVTIRIGLGGATPQT